MAVASANEMEARLKRSNSNSYAYAERCVIADEHRTDQPGGRGPRLLGHVRLQLREGHCSAGLGVGVIVHCQDDDHAHRRVLYRPFLCLRLRQSIDKCSDIPPRSPLQQRMDLNLFAHSLVLLAHQYDVHHNEQHVSGLTGWVAIRLNANAPAPCTHSV